MTNFTMKISLFTSLAALALLPLASALPYASEIAPSSLEPRQACTNSATSRNCWGQYSTSTNWYTTIPNTGVTREYWLSVQNTTLSPDGYARQTINFNGSFPGPLIEANWGDNIVVHVTNNLQHNGTAIHWHGVRQLNSGTSDGVPGVTQCPIPPGSSMTYSFRAEQYGSSWYHSHFTLQYADGLLGPLIIHGPATANYDTDLGVLFLSDWSHTPVAQLWDLAKVAGPPSLANGLINGTNTYNCAGSTDVNCKGGGVKYQKTFVSGKKYLIRIVNTALEGHFQFSIEGHSFQVIANDFVPIVPYTATSLLVNIGQRYDIVVTANAAPGNYWLRAGWQSACSTNALPANMTGIIRYDASSKADPTSVSTVTVSTSCLDEPLASLVPFLPMDVTVGSVITSTLSNIFVPYAEWTFNGSSLLLNWTDPTLLTILDGGNIWPTPYNVIPISSTTANKGWAVFAINNAAPIAASHPIHLHGHDFWTLAQGTGTYTSTTPLKLINPPRRDVMTLPAAGYLVIAFKIDNPGSWLMHCHIAWHASEGLAVQFVESESAIVGALGTGAVSGFRNTCAAWDKYVPTEVYLQGDSGI
ncbi:putative Laccase-2 protein [Rutstroemia sp. NJR-2017a BBW]|nr:putative Laccase-2 protein [Rutstroemia sp. NJR-2017a BBW]